jgi:hypothetical protein
VGKGKRIKAARQATASRRIIVADGLEIGQHQGMVTLRTGRHVPGAAPIRAVVPGPLFQALLQTLRTAAVDAEEEYWELTIPRVRQLGENPDPLVVAAHLEKWLLAEDWQGALRAMPATAPGQPFAITLAGHVGLALSPPCTPTPVLIILDPVQLHRVDDGLRSALAAALADPAARAEMLGQRFADVHRFLARQPWPRNVTSPTHAEAEASMLQHRKEFLGREPFIRPAQNNLYPADDMTGDDRDGVGVEDGQCTRCRISQQIGGILCVCGHDWGCHGDTPQHTEPCSHCACQNMRTPDET